MKMRNEHINDKRLMNVRKLVALDTRFHGMKIILTEFLVAVFLCIALAAWLLFFTSSHTLTSTLLGLYFLGVAMNYVPLLCFALLIRTRDQAVRETEAEMRDQTRHIHVYSLQSILFILVPFALSILALYQFIARRTTS